MPKVKFAVEDEDIHSHRVDWIGQTTKLAGELNNSGPVYDGEGDTAIADEGTTTDGQGGCLARAATRKHLPISCFGACLRSLENMLLESDRKF